MENNVTILIWDSMRKKLLFDGNLFLLSMVKAFSKSICFGQHLNNLCRKNIGHPIMHININSIRLKFDQLVYCIKGNADILD